MYDIIAKKRDGKELSSEEIEFFIRGYTAGEIPDYQALPDRVYTRQKGVYTRQNYGRHIEFHSFPDHWFLCSGIDWASAFASLDHAQTKGVRTGRQSFFPDLYLEQWQPDSQRLAAQT